MNAMHQFAMSKFATSQSRDDAMLEEIDMLQGKVKDLSAVLNHHKTLKAENARLKAELAAAQEDAERLDFIIEKALESRTGVTLDYHKYVEDGQVVERGFRMAWFHHLNPRFKTLREAIDEAIDKEAAKK